MDYASRIREYRERSFLTQGQLAKELGVSNVTVCRWEKGEFEPSMAMKRKLAARFEAIGMKMFQ